MENIGEKIYNLRKSKGITQDQLSELIGVSRQTIYKWETNTVQPTKEKINLLCKVFEVTDGYFFNNINLNNNYEIALTNISERNHLNKKRFVYAIILIVTTIACMISGMIACIIGGTVFSSNTGDKVENINNYDSDMFYLALFVSIISLIVSITMVVLLINDKHRRSANQM